MRSWRPLPPARRCSACPTRRSTSSSIPRVAACAWSEARPREQFARAVRALCETDAGVIPGACAANARERVRPYDWANAMRMTERMYAQSLDARPSGPEGNTCHSPSPRRGPDAHRHDRFPDPAAHPVRRTARRTDVGCARRRWSAARSYPVWTAPRIAALLWAESSSAPYPRGKGEVCKTFMHRFESGRRLSPPPS